MDDPALTTLTTLMLLAAPVAGAVQHRWGVPPIVASDTRLPAPAGAQVRWTTKDLTIAGCYWAPELQEVGGHRSILIGSW
ncbi:hypothetical protein [uncultured Sphingomonas sp.]|uniref:hypothetical protein n=1 Tax=uncultured Sphingomonas sp. TaxID=158754 RepID=UPI002585876B|nr:hypothetical protein [uncultured Sphingomonas sp.]